MIICFDRHPLETVAPERAPLLLQSPSERTNILYRLGLTLLTLEFTSATAALSASEWIRKMHDDYGVDVLVVGYDNTFGSDGVMMNIADYRRLGAEAGVEIVEAPFEPGVSSSAIRRMVSDGDIEGASAALGRPFAVAGTVEDGKHLGRNIGFPTANVKPAYKALLPKNGVYAVEAVTADGRSMKGVANVGKQPTVAQRAPLRLEVHIPGFSGNLYGERLEVRFLRRLRDEMKFDSIEALKQQITKDIQQI